MLPVQRPHPPLWLGIENPDSTRFAAQNKINMVCNRPAPQVKALTDRYREEWERAGGSPDQIPILGMNRHIVVADTEREALAVAKPAFDAWLASLNHLWVKNNIKVPHTYPNQFEDAVRLRFFIAGTPQTVRDMIASQVADAGINYLMCRLAFGDLPYESSLSFGRIDGARRDATARTSPCGLI